MNIDLRTYAGMVPSREEPGDYHQDGRLYCGKCRTPKQSVISVGGEVLTVPCLCRCALDAWQAEQERLREKDRRDRVDAMRTRGIADKAMEAYTLDRDDGHDPQTSRKVKYYIDRWADMKRTNTGLLFWGPTGTGKTFAAGCIANALLDRGVPVLVTSFPRIIAELSGMRDDKVVYLDSLRRYDLLIIDDLGAERQSEYALEAVYQVVDAREKIRKPMIVTTNLTLAELRNPVDRDRWRIYDRVLKICLPVAVDGENVRRAEADRKLEELRRALSE